MNVAVRLFVGLALFVACGDGSATLPADSTSSSSDSSHGSGGETTAPSTSSGTDTGESEWPALFRVGERLRPIVHRADAGDEIFVGWRDTELEIDCLMLSTASGERHCLPKTIGGLVYSDEKCTQEAIRLGCDAPELATIVAPQCAGPFVAFEPWKVGEMLGEAFCFDDNGACKPCSGSGFYRATKLELDGFVSATQEVNLLEGRLARVEIEGADGSMEWKGPYDVRLEAFCEVLDIDDASVCVSVDRVTLMADAHHDPACETPVGFAYLGNCSPPDVAVGRDDSLWLLGEPLDNSKLYAGTGPGDCIESSWSVSEDTGFFTLVATTAAEFPRADVTASGGGRLRPRLVQTTDGGTVAAAAPERWYDEVLETTCQAWTTVDGTILCAPNDAFLDPVFFADERCSQPLVPAKNVSDADLHTLYESSTCGSRIAGVARAGADYNGPVYDRFSGSCRLLEDPSVHGPFLRVVDKRGADELATLEKVVL